MQKQLQSVHLVRKLLSCHSPQFINAEGTKTYCILLIYSEFQYLRRAPSKRNQGENHNICINQDSYSALDSLLSGLFSSYLQHPVPF